MRQLVTLIVAGVLAAVTARRLVWYRRLQGIAAPAGGMFPSGMAYAHVGTGPKTLLFIRGGTGVPFGRLFVLMSIVWMRPFLEAGYTIWVVARKQGMSAGYSVADMADDYAALIKDEFDGKVDLVIGEEAIGGMTAFSLAARHPETFSYLAVMLAGYRLSEAGRVFERDFARLQSEGRMSEAGTLLIRLLAPDLRVPALYPVLGPLLMRFITGETYPSFAQDVTVEAEAISAFDGRTLLPQIGVPVLLIGCDQDFEFSKETYEETATLIPDCTLRMYEGKTGVQAGSDRRLPRDVLEFAHHHSDTDAEPATGGSVMRSLMLKAGRASLAGWLRGTDLDPQFLGQAQAAYDRLADRVPWPRHPSLKYHVAFSVLPGAAIYGVLRDEGESEEEAARVIAERLAAMAVPRHRLYRRLFCSRSGIRLFMWLAGRSLWLFPAPGWQATWIERSSRRVAFDFTRCFDLETLRMIDAAPIAPGYCAVDDVLYANLCPRLRWARSGTLATGADRCDFRFERRPLSSRRAPMEAAPVPR